MTTVRTFDPSPQNLLEIQRAFRDILILLPRSTHDATTDPTTSDDITQGWKIASQWFNVSADNIWVCADPVASAAVWRKLATIGPSGGANLSLDDLTDVTITGPIADNELLAYDSGSGQWINQTAAEAGIGAGGVAFDATLSGSIPIIRGLDSSDKIDETGVVCTDADDVSGMNSLSFAADKPINFATGPKSRILHHGTTDDLYIGLTPASGGMAICELADIGHANRAISAQTDPLLRLYGADETDASDYVELQFMSAGATPGAFLRAGSGTLYLVASTEIQVTSGPLRVTNTATGVNTSTITNCTAINTPADLDIDLAAILPTELHLFNSNATVGAVANLRIDGSFQSEVATGTAPLIVASETLVTKLNADLLDGQHASAFALAANAVTAASPFGAANRVLLSAGADRTAQDTALLYLNGSAPTEIRTGGDSILEVNAEGDSTRDDRLRVTSVTGVDGAGLVAEFRRKRSVGGGGANLGSLLRWQLWNASSAYFNAGGIQYITQVATGGSESVKAEFLLRESGSDVYYFRLDGQNGYVESVRPFVVTSTSYMRVAKGNNAQRPVSPVDGDVRYNTDVVAGGKFEFRENGAWLNLGVTDHGALTGLGDDDHTQYLLASGTRALTGTWGAGAQQINNVAKLGLGTASPHADPVLHLARNGSAVYWDGIDAGTGHSYQSFYPRGVGAGRKGWFGFGTPSPGAGYDDLTFSFEDTGELIFESNRATDVTTRFRNIGAGLMNLVVDGDLTVQGGDLSAIAIINAAASSVTFKDVSGDILAVIRSSPATPVSYPVFDAVAGTDSVVYGCDGTGDNIDIKIDPKGTGIVVIPANVDVTGNITVSGTVDGVDVRLHDHADDSGQTRLGAKDRRCEKTVEITAPSTNEEIVILHSFNYGMTITSVRHQTTNGNTNFNLHIRSEATPFSASGETKVWTSDKDASTSDTEETSFTNSAILMSKVLVAKFNQDGTGDCRKLLLQVEVNVN